MKTLQTHRFGGPELNDDQTIPDELTARLCHATAESVPDVIAGLTSAQRANLARFCYRKAHLRDVGLAIAATCDEDSLIGAWGRTLGHALFAQSHGAADFAPAPTGRTRPAITLGTMAAPPLVVH